MKNLSPSTSNGTVRLLTAVLLAYTLLMTPLAPLAAAAAGPSAAPPSTPGNAAPPKGGAGIPAVPAPAPAPAGAPEVSAVSLSPRPAAALSPAALFAPLVGVVTATLSAAVAPDDGDSGKIDPTTGDASAEKITYTATLSNGSATNATDLTFSIPLDAHTTLVPGSLNSTPVAFDVAVPPFNEDPPSPVTITLGAQDPDNNALTFSVVTPPANGTLGTPSVADCATTPGICTSTLTYTPNANFYGADPFTFKVNDGKADSNETGTVSIQVNGVNDPPTFTTTGNPPASNEDAGAQTVNAFLTSISPGPGESTQTVSFIVTANSNSALFQTQPAIDSTGKLTYTAAANKNGTATITYHAKDNGGTTPGVDVSPDQNFTITVNAVNDPPVVPNKDYGPNSAQANMRISIPQSNGLLQNITDPDTGDTLPGNTTFSPTFVLGSVNGSSTVNGGMITGTVAGIGTVSANVTTGAFDFDPAPGVTGPITFNFSVCDNGNPTPAACTNATATFNVAGPVIWFVNPAAGVNGLGTLSSPFNSLASATSAMGINAGHRIFIYSGTTASGAGVTLQGTTAGNNLAAAQAASQWLIGQGVAGASFDSVMGISPPAGTIGRPGIGGTRPLVRGTVTMKENTTVRGLNIDVSGVAGTNKGLTATNPLSAGTSGCVLTVNDVSITSSTGAAVDFTSAQTLNYTGSNNVIQSATGTAVIINGTTIGSGGVTFASVTVTGTPTVTGAPNGILLNNTGSSGAFTVSGAAAFGTNASGAGPAGTAISITGHGGGLSFNGVTIDRRGNTGIHLNNVSGTVNFAGTTTVNNQNNAGGHGVRIESSSAAVTFPTLNVSNARQIVAQTDSGDGFPDNDGDGDAVFLKNNTGSLTISGGTLLNSAGDGIDIRAAQNLTLSNVTINGVGSFVGTTANAGGIGGHAIFAWDLKGTNSITNSTITNWEAVATNGLRWWLQGSGSATMTIKGTTFSNSGDGATNNFPSNAILYRGGGTTVSSLTVGGPNAGDACNFTNIYGEAIGHAAGEGAGSTATANITIEKNTFSGTPNGGQNTMSARNTEGGKTNIVVKNNTFDTVAIHPADTSGVIDIGGDGTLAGNSVSFLIKDNIIKNVGNANLSPGGLKNDSRRAIDVFIDDSSAISGTPEISGNRITNVRRVGILFDVGGTSNPSNMSAKIINNCVGKEGSAPGVCDGASSPVGVGTALSSGGESGIRVENRNPNAKPLNVLISGNTVRNGISGVAGSGLNGSGIFLRTQNTATMSATVTNNNVTTLNSSTANALRADTNFSAGNNTVLCLNATGNTLVPATGASAIAVNEFQGILNVQQSQADLSSQNNGATVAPPGGTPQFGTVTCTAAPDAAALDGRSRRVELAQLDNYDLLKEFTQTTLALMTAGDAPNAPLVAETKNSVEADAFGAIALLVNAAEAADRPAESAAQTATAEQSSTVEQAASATAAAPRVWSDMPSGSETGDDEVADATADRASAYGARTVNVSYERPEGERAGRADAPVGDAVAATNAATAEPAADNGAAVYASMALALVAAFDGGQIITINGAGQGFTLPVGRTVTVTFQVTLNNPPNFTGVPPAAPQVSVHGTLSGAFAGNPIVTDDPASGASNDPTVTGADLFNTTSAITGALPSNSTNTGQAVTFTASITPTGSPAPAGGTLPGGSAVFKDNGTAIAGCNPVSVTSGQAQCTTSALTTGTHNNITVEYGGDGNFDPSNSNASPFTQTVTQSGTTTTVASSLNPSLVTQDVTFTAEVSSATAFGPPTGSVQFRNGPTGTGTALGAPVALTTGGSCPAGKACASTTVNTLTAATHTITADYVPDAAFTASNGSVSQVVNKSDTAMTLATSASPVTPGTSVTFTATINSSTSVSAARTGTVTFYDGDAMTGTPIAACGSSGVVTVSSNQAQCSTSSLSEASHTITAVYSGDGTYNTVSNTVAQVVAKNGTSTALASSLNPSRPDEAVTFTATVTASSGTPTGNVAFKNNGVDITGCASVALNGSGQAQCTVPANTFVEATHPITAVYGGDSTYDGSTSSVLNQVVSACTATTLVTNTNDGGSGSLRAAIGGVCEGGTVTFSNNTSGGATNFYDGNTHTITLTSAELALAKHLTIQGPGSGAVIVSGDNARRVFTVAPGRVVQISGLTATLGRAPDGAAGAAGAGGGAILNSGTLTLTGVTVSNSNAGAGGAGGASAGGNGGSGGGIYNDASGTLFVVNSTVSGNQTGAGGTGTPAGSGGAGGGVYNLGTLFVNGSTLSGNKALGAAGAGGGVANGGSGIVTLINSTLSGNTANGDGGGLLHGSTSSAILSNSTITNNRSDNDNDGGGEGGGLRLSATGAATLNNTIVAGNFKGMGGAAFQSETATVIGSITDGVHQVETVTVLGAITSTGAGNAKVVVTAAGMTNSPKTVFVAVANDDTAAQVAGKIRTALVADQDIGDATTGFFTVSGSADQVVLTARTAAANDATMNILVDNDSSAGLSPANSADTTAGSVNAAVTVTAAGMANSPKTVNVPVGVGDDASAVAGKIRTALGADTDVSAFFNVTGSADQVVLTAKAAAANDATMNVATDNDTSVGLTAQPTSADTAAGFGGSSANDIDGTVNGTFNLVGTGGAGGLLHGTDNNQVGVDPTTVFDASGLANNGGPTQTVALKTGSPAIDTGSGALTALTTLGAGIDDTATTVTVAAGGSIPAGYGYAIRVDSEQMIVTGKTGNQLTVTRGAGGTTAASHSNGAGVFAVVDQRGLPRPVNSDGNAPPSTGDDSDIGAYETQNQPAAPNAPDLDAASDTGASDTDNITGDTSPTFSVGGVVPGATVELLRVGSASPVASGVAAGTTIQLTDPSAPTGAQTYKARQTVGGAPASAESATLTITIDTSAPGAPSTPDLQAASDSGLDQTDNITKTTPRVFDVAGTESGSTVELLRDTVPSGGTPVVVASVGGNGSTVQLTDSTALADGVYAYSARQTNGVGASTSSAGSLSVTMDNTAPSAPAVPDLQAGSDSNITTDNITNAASRVFDIGGTTTGERVELYRGVTFVGFTAGNGASLVQINDTAAADGLHQYSARQVDAAGNFAASSALPVTIDTTATPAVPDLQAGSDSGSSSTDNVTKTNPRAFDIVSTESGSTVELLRGGSPVANAAGNGATVTLSDSDGSLADNTYAYAARQTDIAGNVGTSAALNVVIDKTVTPNVPDLDAASDTGALNTDNRTGAATPRTFNVNISEAGSKVELLRGGTPVTGAFTTGPAGNVQLNDPDPLSDGTYQYSTRETDAAGNIATSSALGMTIDTAAPAVSSAARADANPTSAASVNFTVTFNEPVTGVDAADFATTMTGGVTGASVTNVSGSGAVYTVTASTGSGDGTLRLDVLNDGTIKDAMNLALGAGFTTGQVYNIDRLNPTVSSITRAGTNPTGAASVTFNVSFSEAVSGVDTGDFNPVMSGVSGATVTGVSPASGPSQSYTVTVSTGTGTPGTLGLNLVDNDSIIDVVSKPLGGSGAGNGNFTGEVYNIDKTPPNTTAAKAAGQDDPAHGPTSSTVINFTVTFTKPVTGFNSSDVTIGGTAGATVANVSQVAPNDGTTYNVAVEGMTTTGTVTVSVAAGVAADDAGNTNNASGTASVNFVPDNFSAFVVNAGSDPGDGTCDPIGTGDGCTLREAITAANADFGAETITFDPTVFTSPGPHVISLGSALPDLTTDVTISGPGANVLTVKRNVAGPFRIFFVHGGATASISGLTADSGNASNGGANIRVGDGPSDTATLTLTRVAVTGGAGNSFGGGLAVLSGSTLNIVESEISGNQTTAGDGGGIYNDGGTLSLVNSTVGGNSAASNNGGGIYTNGNVTLANSTVANNTATAGGGLYRNAGTVTFKSTIVGDNTATAAGTSDLSGTFTSDGFNLFESVGTATVTPNGGAGPDITGQDSQFELDNTSKPSLKDNGGPTRTIRLQCTSPAIDQGKAFGATVDQRGLVRAFDFADSVYPNATGGDGTDIGAYESQTGGGCIPVAVAPTPTTNEDTTAVVTMTGTFSQNSPLTFTVTQAPANGALANQSAANCTFDGGTSTNTCTATVEYTPSLNYNGPDTFSFKVSVQVGAGTIDSESAEVQVTVNAVNDAPVATPASVLTDEDTPLAITLAGTDVDSAVLSFTVLTQPTHGTLSGTAPNLTYTPAADYYTPAVGQEDTFTFKVNDGSLDSAPPATVKVTVRAVNDAPVAANDSYEVNENTPLSVTALQGVLKNDTDVDSGSRTAVLAAGPSHAASFTLNANGSFSYTPAANFFGTDTFTYRADDGNIVNNLSAPATVTITVKPAGALQFSAADYSIKENAGTFLVTVTRTGGDAGATTINYATTAAGTAAGGAACGAGVDFVTTSGTLSWADKEVAAKTFTVTVCDDSLFEADKTVNLVLSGITGSGEAGPQGTATLTINDDDAKGGVFGFGQQTYSVGERDGFATVTVTRTGDTTRAASVDYTTDDGSNPHVPVPCASTTGNALERCDYTASFGTLRFAANETSKTFVVLVTDDSYTEGAEGTALKLSNPTEGGALSLSGGAAATLQIQDDVPESAGNRNDDDASFVAEHYHDFLGRHPDAAGLQFWTDGITSCGSDLVCRQIKRINTSAAFFLSIEFQNTGFFAYRVHKAAFGDAQGTYKDQQGTHEFAVPAIRLREFLRDSRVVGQGVAVNVGNWQQQLETNKRALALEVVQRPEFIARYPALTTASVFVNSLDTNTGGVLTEQHRLNLITALSANPSDVNLRADVLRQVSETEPFKVAEKNRAFVLMQYFGYLRRNANEAPEAGLDYSGYIFWLSKLNAFDGNFIDAEMVKAFLDSIEYRQRFGQQ